MLRDTDREKEILLGNKQLLGIFFLVVILLGVAFGGGYKLGQGSRKGSATDEPAAATSTNSSGVETRTVAPEGATTTGTESPQPSETMSPGPARAADTATDQPLGAPARTKRSEAPAPAPARVATGGGFSPQPGQTFLQVAAVGRDEAEAISDVLRKKGFHAHSVPKPGSKLYRVIIGPMRDAGDLSTTRALLRNTGFREIFVQRY